MDACFASCPGRQGCFDVDELHSTRLDVADWSDFRDPAGWWERTYYQAGAQWEHQIESAVRQATEDHMFDDFDPRWVEFLRANVQVPA